MHAYLLTGIKGLLSHSKKISYIYNDVKLAITFDELVP